MTDQAMAPVGAIDHEPVFQPRPPGSELTWQALFAAVVVAAIMGATYPYMVLKLGFGPNVRLLRLHHPAGDRRQVL